MTQPCCLQLNPLPATANQSQDALDVLDLINHMRKENGLDPLQVSPVLERATDRHSVDMAIKRFLSTTGV